MPDFDQKKVLDTLNTILEMELAGVVRYNHYSFMIYGHSRIPITGWLRGLAQESMIHAQDAGELITTLGGHPSLGIGPLLETEKHHIDDILRESLEHETAALDAYELLLDLVQGKSVLLEEFARKRIYEETLHIAEVDKMLRKPGDLEPAEGPEL